MEASLFDAFSGGNVSLVPDGSLVIKSALSRYVAWGGTFLILAPLSFFLWSKRVLKHITIPIFFSSFVIPLIVLPGFAIDSVRITPTTLSFRTGFWFAPKVRNYSLEGLALVYEHSKRGRVVGEPRNVFWTFYWKDGRMVDLDLPDLFTANREGVRKYLSNLGIDILKTRDTSPGG